MNKASENGEKDEEKGLAPLDPMRANRSVDEIESILVRTLSLTCFDFRS